MNRRQPETGLYTDDFAEAFKKALTKCGVTCYEISKYCHLDEAYLSRLKSGERSNPSVESIIKIALALAHSSQKFSISDAEALLNSAGRSLLPKQSRRHG